MQHISVSAVQSHFSVFDISNSTIMEYDITFDFNKTHQGDQAFLASGPSLSSTSPNLPFSNSYHCIATLKGHTSYISSLVLAGKFLYSGSSDREIQSWKRTALHSEFKLESSIPKTVNAGKGAVKSLVIHDDKIFSAHQDHKIRVWKVSNFGPDRQRYNRLATLPTLGDRASKILIPKNHVQIRRHKTRTWVHHVDAVSALVLSKDKTLLYSVSWDRTIKIWKTSDFTCLESVSNAHDDAINAMAISDAGHVYTGSADMKIKVWRKFQGQKKHSLVNTLKKHHSGVNALALSNDGSVLFSGACDGLILVWEKVDYSDKMIVASTLRGHTKSILCLAVVLDLVCSGSADKTIRIWRSVDRNHSCLMVLEGHGGPIKCLAAAIDCCTHSSKTLLVYSASLDCEVKVWQIFVTVS